MTLQNYNRLSLFSFFCNLAIFFDKKNALIAKN